MEELVALIVAALIKEEIALLPAEIDLISRGFAAFVTWVEGSSSNVNLASEAAIIVNGILKSKAFPDPTDEHDECIAAVTAYASSQNILATDAEIGTLVGTLIVANHAQ